MSFFSSRKTFSCKISSSLRSILRVKKKNLKNKKKLDVVFKIENDVDEKMKLKMKSLISFKFQIVWLKTKKMKKMEKIEKIEFFQQVW